MDDSTLQTEDLPQVEATTGTDVSTEVASAADNELTLYDSAGDVVVTSSSPDSVSAAVANSPGVYASADTGTYYELASRVVENSIPVDYLFYRSGQYEYTLVYGDIDVAGTLFTGDSCSYLRWYRDGTSYGYLVDKGTTSVNVDSGNYIVFSSAPGFPALDVSTAFETFVIGFVALVAVLLYCLSKMFGYVLRTKDG